MSARRSLTTASLAGAALLIATAPAMAGGFGGTSVLRTAAAGTQIRVGDIAARGAGVVVGWQENAPGGTKAVYLRRSNDGGATFRSAVKLDTRPSREIQVDVCDGWAWAASTVKEAGSWFVALDKRALVGGVHGSYALSPSTQVRGPDVACAGERLVVAWFQKVGGTWRVKLHARGVNDEFKGDQLDEIDLDLGPGDMREGLALAGTGDHVFLAWFNGSDFKFRRWDIGPGPVYSLGNASTANLPDLVYGRDPKIGVSGDRLVLAYMNRADLRARVSTDAAASWEPGRILEDMPFPSEVGAYPTSADVIGTRIVVAGTIVGGLFDDLNGEGFLVRSTNDGGSWNRVPGSTKADGQVVGAYRGTAGSPKLVEAWDKWIADPAVHKLRFQRES